MRSLSLCHSTVEEPTSQERRQSAIEYVSLTELRKGTNAARSPRLLYPLSADQFMPDDDDDNDQELSDRDRRNLRRLQDILLMNIVGLAIALLCWGCVELYRGHVCLPDSERLLGPSCIEYGDKRDMSNVGAPDVVIRKVITDEVALAFQGGWSFTSSLFHVSVTAFLLLSIVLARLTSSAVYRRSVLWIWFISVELCVMFHDASLLRRWRQSTCPMLQGALTTFHVSGLRDDGLGGVHVPLDDVVATCVTTNYEAYLFVEALLAVELAGLVLLEPVVYRLYCGLKHPSTPTTSDILQQQHLAEEDCRLNTPYRKL